MPVAALTPAWVVNTFLLGVPLGDAWQEPATLPDGSPNPNAGQLTPAGEAALTQVINGLIAEVQGKLGIRFERQRVVTDPDPGMVLGTDYELRGERLHYFRPTAGQGHFTLPLPYANVVSIERVRLFYQDRAVQEVPATWLSFTSKEGVLRINPYLNNTLMASTAGAWNGVWFGYGLRDILPAAWSVDYTIGHGQVDDDVARYIGLRAAMQLLGTLGASPAMGGGLSNESLSMDGVTESVGYATGKYGVYSGLIQQYSDELDHMDIWQMRLTKKGIKLGVW